MVKETSDALEKLVDAIKDRLLPVLAKMMSLDKDFKAVYHSVGDPQQGEKREANDEPLLFSALKSSIHSLGAKSDSIDSIRESQTLKVNLVQS